MTYLLIFIGTMLIGLYASWRVRSAYKKYSQMPASSGYTGAKIAQRILDINGITDVTIQSQPGTLTDHYDPRHKVLVLSEANYHGNSVAALGVSAHECGHAIQHQKLYAPLQWRMAAVGITGIASQFGFFVPLLLATIGLIPMHLALVLVTISLGIVLAFQLITLPVEFDATARAKAILAQTGALQPGEETEGMNKVLDAAALTYVAAFLSSLAYFLYYLMRMMGSRR